MQVAGKNAKRRSRSRCILVLYYVYCSHYASVLCTRSRNTKGCVRLKHQPGLASVLQLAHNDSIILNVEGATPSEALNRLSKSLPGTAQGRDEWRKKARVAAVMGSCPRSHRSFKSGWI